MLRTIHNPIVYAAGPEVFNTNRNDAEEMSDWGKKHGFKILHPSRHSHLPQDQIYANCKRDATAAHVIVADLNNFRGFNADDGTSIEIGLAVANGAVVIGYKDKREDANLRHGPIRKHGGFFLDKDGYFIEQGTDRNLMVMESLHKIFYGNREIVLEEIAKYIKDNVVSWKRHEDPILGSKYMPPDTQEKFETLTPNLEIDMTRWLPIIERPELRRLRETKQLGALFWIYPGATHTRYEHLVMTYKFTHDMLHHLPLTREDKTHVLAYALLHDIGHTPYSHELEEITGLDQMKAALHMFENPGFKDALSACDLDLELLSTFFKKNNPYRAIVSDKVLGTDKLAYLLRDGLATGKGGYDNIDLLIEHTVFEDGKFGIDEKGVDSAKKQILLYVTTYAATYYSPQSKLNQRIFTLLGQIGIEEGILPSNWYSFNDLWYDYHNILGEQQGNLKLRKLGGEGIVKDAYLCVASMRLKDAFALEQSGISLFSLDEEDYANYLCIPVLKRKALEDELCRQD